MGLLKRFWIIFVIFGLILAASFWIQATSGNPVSKYFLEWAVSWSSFIGTFLAAIAVFIAIVTFWEGNRKNKNEAKLKIKVWAYRHFAAAFGNISALLQSEHPNKKNITEVINMLISSLDDFAEIEMYAESIGPDMTQWVDDLVKIAVSVMSILYDVSNFSGNEFLTKRTELLELKKKATGYLKKIHEYKV